jgi:hypothetical protein
MVFTRFHAFSRVRFSASLGRKARRHQGLKAEMEGGLAPVSVPATLRTETGAGLRSGVVGVWPRSSPAVAVVVARLESR